MPEEHSLHASTLPRSVALPCVPSGHGSGADDALAEPTVHCSGVLAARDGWQRVVLPLSSFSDAVARELEAQLATERGGRRNETHRAEEAEGLVQLSHLRGWMDEAAPLSPLMPRPMPSAASPDTEAHRRNFLPRWAPRVGNQELHRELAADEALRRPRQRASPSCAFADSFAVESLSSVSSVRCRTSALSASSASKER